MVDEQTGGHIAAPRRSGRRLMVAFLLLVVIVGGALAVALQFPAAQRQLLALLGREAQPDRLVNASPVTAPSTAALPPAATGQGSPLPGAPSAGATPLVPGLGPDGIDARMTLFDARLARLEMETRAASGNAARAEGLLVAFAVRRALDRGAQLGFLEEQLRLRFADSQPNAVQTLIATSSAPVTLDSLYGELDALGPDLTGGAPAQDSWGWIKREVSQLFIIRHQSGSPIRADDRLARAKLMLAAGKIGEAIAEVERLPGAEAAKDWIVAARRYDSVQRALEIVETTALLDSSRLKSADGAKPEPAPAPQAGPTV